MYAKITISMNFEVIFFFSLDLNFLVSATMENKLIITLDFGSSDIEVPLFWLVNIHCPKSFSPVFALPVPFLGLSLPIPFPNPSPHKPATRRTSPSTGAYRTVPVPL